MMKNTCAHKSAGFFMDINEWLNDVLKVGGIGEIMKTVWVKVI